STPPTFILSQNQTLQFFGSSSTHDFRRGHLFRQDLEKASSVLFVLNPTAVPTPKTKNEAEASNMLPKSLLSSAGHDRVPAETKRDQLPNCQRSFFAAGGFEKHSQRESQI
ncbi:MAG: hypothetical protein WCJ21_04220, partial [Planctomycetota bacterium]